MVLLSGVLMKSIDNVFGIRNGKDGKINPDTCNSAVLASPKTVSLHPASSKGGIPVRIAVHRIPFEEYNPRNPDQLLVDSHHTVLESSPSPYRRISISLLIIVPD
ncbi:hypothetical protein BGAL_0101g00040 [Botrytis galanthina]|uniref:Uncharacterized protein n=1 Tax=Botrytis galanthina TaxID=278940 RepID=A0A4S8R4P6_9HELO|nr:hypothetical protein BGAL_0101g00040 [Botrytis galanthina]